MAQIKFKVEDIIGRPISGVSVIIDLGNHGLSERITDNNGSTSISGVEIGSTSVMVNMNGYVSQSFDIHVNEADQIVNKEIILISEQNSETPKEAVKEIVHETVGIISPFVFNEPKTYEEAKSVYKDIEKNVQAQKYVIQDAIKNKALDIIQQQASNLAYTLGQQLTASIGWYVEQRSKLKPLETLTDLPKWAAYSSMIGGLFILRNNLVEFLNKILSKLSNGI